MPSAYANIGLSIEYVLEINTSSLYIQVGAWFCIHLVFDMTQLYTSSFVRDGYDLQHS